jgi:ATP-dependent DNA helicase RecQ
MLKHLLLLTAPPASGKTFLISSLIKELNDQILFISPLRALANECLSLWGSNCEVMTPEEWSGEKRKSKVVILDEFHLYFYWGDTFRPQMWEAFYEMVEEIELVILLTATLTLEMQREIKKFEVHFDQIFWIDHGNQKLKYHPLNYYQAYTAKWIQQKILSQKKSSDVSLIFCAYRQEVLKWEKTLTKNGYRVWSCVGGEATRFSLRAQVEEKPDFIVSTTVLSHGVNLPSIARIYFLYEVKNLDFWIQMVARGGRKGETFEVFALEPPVGIKWNKFTNALAIAGLSFKMKMQQLMTEIEEWFLKV